jgi:organic hydroperoxide reductase OsmC/OhrA
MKPLPHIYEVKLAGAAQGYAAVSTRGLPELRTAPPREFDGPGDAWSPEQLLLAAIESCFLFTFRAVAAACKIEFTSLELSGQGKLERKEGATRFTEILLRPLLTLPAGADPGAAKRALEKSAKVCFISASLSTPVTVEAEILTGE